MYVSGCKVVVDEFVKVSDHIRKTQFLLTEKKKNFAESYDIYKDKENIPISQDDVFKEVTGTLEHLKYQSREVL